MNSLLIATLLFTLGVTAVDEKAEPVRTYTATVAGKSYDLHLDEPLKLPGTFTNPEIKITASPTRTFPYDGISFAYAAGFNWSADLSDPDIKIWSLNGDDLVIEVFAFSSKVEPSAVVDGMVAKFHTEKSTVQEITHKFNGQDLKGYRIPVKLVDTRLIVDIYDVSSKSATKLLILQDTPPDNADQSKEKAAILDYLNKTLTVVR